MWCYAPGLYLAPAGKRHDQQCKCLKINPAAKQKQSADAKQAEVSATLWKGLMLPLQRKLYVETNIFTYKQDDYM